MLNMSDNPNSEDPSLHGCMPSHHTTYELVVFTMKIQKNPLTAHYF
jgi:hypothetical protein